MSKPRTLDLFAGIGGWSLGLHWAGIEPVAACEIDPWRRARYATNFPDVQIYDDVRTLTAERLDADGVVRPWLIAGSPPCQDASAANTKGRGIDGERTGLYREWLRLVSALRPAWTCAENSPRLRTRGIDRLLGELEALDYTVWPLVVSAGDIGAPHRRERLWIVAHSNRGTGSERRWGRQADGAVGDDDFIADGDGQSRLPVNGQMGGLVGQFGCDAARLGCDGRGSAEAAGWAPPEFAGDAEWNDGRHSDGNGQHSRSAAMGRPARRIGRGRDYGDGPEPDSARREIRQGIGRDPGAELPAALRIWAGGWPRWHGGVAGLAETHAALRADELAHGLPERLAARERNRRLAAFGDTIVPQIAHAIGRAILAVSDGTRTAA